MSVRQVLTVEPKARASGSRTRRKILIVSHYFWPEEFRVNELAASLARRGHHVTVATGTPNYPGHRLFPAYREDRDRFAHFLGKVPVVRFPTLSIGSSKVGLAANYLSLACSMLLLAPWKLRKESYDVVFCFQPSPFTIALPALLLSRLKKAPLILWVLDCWPETLEAIGVVRRPSAIRAVGVAVGAVYRRCSLVLGQSQAFAASIRHWSGQDNFRHFPNWIEDAFAGACNVPSRAQESEHFRIVFAGNIGEAQDFPTVLEAIDALRDEPVRWIIAGAGRRAEWLSQALAARNLTHCVEMTGRLPSYEMPALFASADALLVSLARKPIFAMTVPGKVQSYMAAGKPIVGLLDGEGRRLIQSVGCGLAAPAGDASALVKNVRSLVDLPASQRDAMGALGREFASREFDRERLIDSLEEWMDETVHRTPRNVA